MFTVRMIVVALCLIGSTALAASGGRSGFGIQAGIGAPFVTQFGATYYFNNNFGLDVGYNALNITVGEAKLDLTMPEVLVHWHPFSGSFFVGAGVGQETLTAVAKSPDVDETAEIKVTAMTTVAKLGWKWGSDNGGFWFGIDASYVMPSGAKTELTTSLPESDEAYQDAVDAGDKFGSTAYTNLTFARFGWIF